MAISSQLPNDKEWSSKADLPQITLRSTITGLIIGTVILISNFQFGLQTGWVSMMSLPSALLGFAVFKSLQKRLSFEFTDVENVFVQSVSVAVATGPLAYGFIGIIPAIEKFLTNEESGYTEGIDLHPIWKLTVWSAGVAFFGVFFAIPLRKEYVIKENLPFPSGSATATLISVFHGTSLKIEPASASTNVTPSRDIEREDTSTEASSNGQARQNKYLLPIRSLGAASIDSSLSQPSETERLLDSSIADGPGPIEDVDDNEVQSVYEGIRPYRSDMTIIESQDLCRLTQISAYHSNLKLLINTSAGAAAYTIVSYFIPQIRAIPLFGNYISRRYLINFQPSPAYIGQGIIMGFETTAYMLFGAILGWFVLSPLAQHEGWAPGDINDWKTGSEGWIMWISLSIMISDSVVSLIVVIVRTLLHFVSSVCNPEKELATQAARDISQPIESSEQFSSSVEPTHTDTNHSMNKSSDNDSTETTQSVQMLRDVSKKHLVPNVWVFCGLTFSCILCVFSTRAVFGTVIPIYAIVISVIMSLFLSILGVKALGETDLNPVSGIGKLSQLICALCVPKNTRGSILINLISGAISEATTQQAGDLMQDLKTGYLLGASPRAQFAAQVYGSIFSIFMSSLMYKVYTSLYQIPGKLFKIPTAVIWIDCARLVSGTGLPPKVLEFSVFFGILFGTISLLKNLITDKHNRCYKYLKFLPDGVPVGIGIYNVPSFTFARFIGGFISYYYLKCVGDCKHCRDGRVRIIIFSSGLVLGEGLFSVVNMILFSLNVPHL